MRSMGYCAVLMTLLLMLANNGFSVGANVWLSYWSNKGTLLLANETNILPDKYYLGIYTVLGLGQGHLIFSKFT